MASKSLNRLPSRGRIWASIVYPESAPNNWTDILSNLHIPAFVSPLHDSDLDPTGEPKKPHFHVLLMFEGVKTPDQVRELISTFGGVGVEFVNSVRGYARYLCHLDNPDKARYDQDKVLALSGADYQTIINLASDKYQTLKEITQFCRQNLIYSYADLFDYCAEYNAAWYYCLCDVGTLVVKEYLKSMRWTDTNLKKTIDK